jgi:hypothetical protein
MRLRIVDGNDVAAVLNGVGCVCSVWAAVTTYTGKQQHNGKNRSDLLMHEIFLNFPWEWEPGHTRPAQRITVLQVAGFAHSIYTHRCGVATSG